MEQRSDRAAWLAWCEQRDASVQAVPGNLALVAYQPMDARPEPVEELPEMTGRREGDEPGVRITIPDGVEAELDGRRVQGEVLLERLRGDGTPLLHVGRLWVDAFSLDGSDYELRIYSADAPNLSNFERIERYDFDPSFIVPGRFEPSPDVDAVPWGFTRASDEGHTKQVPGTFSVTLDATTYDLVAFQDGGELVVVFADGTTGRESYAPGRFLRVPRPEGAAELLVDLNRCFIPPCGFSDFYSCPIPPPGNKLPLDLPVGEKRVVWKEPRH